MKRAGRIISRTFGPGAAWLPVDLLFGAILVRDHDWILIVVLAPLLALDLRATLKRFPHTRLGR